MEATFTERRDAPSDDTRRVIISRRSLLSGRALAGALLVTVAAVGAFSLGNRADAGPRSQFAVLTTAIEPGQPVTAGDFVFEAMELPEALAAMALAETDRIEDGRALRLLRAGELLLQDDLRGPTLVDDRPLPVIHELTLPVPVDRAPDRLLRGDRVSLLAHDDRTGETTVAVEDAIVVGFESDSDGLGSSREARLTLALDDPSVVLRSAHLSFTELTVVLTTGALGHDYPDTFSLPDASLPAEGAES